MACPHPHSSPPVCGGGESVGGGEEGREEEEEEAGEEERGREEVVERKEMLIGHILGLQNALHDLSQRISVIQEENCKLKSENQVWLSTIPRPHPLPVSHSRPTPVLIPVQTNGYSLLPWFCQNVEVKVVINRYSYSTSLCYNTYHFLYTA